MNLKNILEQVIEVCKLASNEIMVIYQQDFITEYKVDMSPLTQADKASHEVIISELTKFGFPIISEESEDDVNGLDAEYFWLIDPLDGTKEFINKNGEFTVNIALIHDNRPILSVIAIPAQNIIYYALENCGAFCINASGNRQQIFASIQSDIAKTKIAVSRSHLKYEDENFIVKNKIQTVVPLGSALKYCYIADGQIDLSIRFTPLMSWDIAASDIILLESGAKLQNFAGDLYHYQLSNIRQPLIKGILVSNNILKTKIIY